MLPLRRIGSRVGATEEWLTDWGRWSVVIPQTSNNIRQYMSYKVKYRNRCARIFLLPTTGALVLLPTSPGMNAPLPARGACDGHQLANNVRRKTQQGARHDEYPKKTLAREPSRPVAVRQRKTIARTRSLP